MLLEVIRSLYRYNAWANDLVMEAAAGPTADRVLAAGVASYSSVQTALVHTMSAQWIWLSRWQGTSPRAMLDLAEFPTARTTQDRWAVIEGTPLSSSQRSRAPG